MGCVLVFVTHFLIGVGRSSPQKVNLDGRSVYPWKYHMNLHGTDTNTQGSRPALQADFVCTEEICQSWSWENQRRWERPSSTLAFQERSAPILASPKLPWEGGAKIGLALWQEGDTHQMPFTTEERSPLASSVSACPSGQHKLLFVCRLCQPQQVEPSPTTRACWITNLSEKRKSRWSAFGQGESCHL